MDTVFLASAIGIGILIGTFLACKTADLMDWAGDKIWHYRRRKILAQPMPRMYNLAEMKEIMRREANDSS